MDALFYVAVAFVGGLIGFSVGYLAAVREAGKEIRFLKDCSERQRNTIVGYMQEVDRMQRVIKGD